MSEGLFVHCPFCDIEFTVHGDHETLASWTWLNCPRCSQAIRLNQPERAKEAL